MSKSKSSLMRIQHLEYERARLQAQYDTSLALLRGYQEAAQAPATQPAPAAPTPVAPAPTFEERKAAATANARTPTQREVLALFFTFENEAEAIEAAEGKRR